MPFGGICWVFIHKVLVLQMSGLVILRDYDLVRTFILNQFKVKVKLQNAIFEAQNKQGSWDVGSRFHLLLPRRSPAVDWQAGLSHMWWELPREELCCLHHPVIPFAGERACVCLLPVPALEMARVMQKELILQNLSRPQSKKEGNYYILVTTSFTTGTFASVCSLHNSILSLPSPD